MFLFVLARISKINSIVIYDMSMSRSTIRVGTLNERYSQEVDRGLLSR